jgi:hypothetical protein
MKKHFLIHFVGIIFVSLSVKTVAQQNSSATQNDSLYPKNIPALLLSSNGTVIKTKKELDNLPVIANANFGHTTPIFTFPVGGKATLVANKKETSLRIIEH